MTIEGLHEFIDVYADTQLSKMFLNVNGKCTSFDSKVWTRAWDDLKGSPVEERDLLPYSGRGNMRLLHERGLDPYAVWIDRCREHGIAGCLSMRMNDVHHTHEPEHPNNSVFWREHPECWRVQPPNEGGIHNHWERGLDYEHEEVREYNLALIRELFERYDMDGLELDFMRDAYCFAPGREQVGLNILTDFVRTVRGLSQEWSAKRGHAIELSVRVPATPETAAGFGLDGVRWAQEGLIDLLVVASYIHSTDFDIPIERWRGRCTMYGTI